MASSDADGVNKPSSKADGANVSNNYALSKNITNQVTKSTLQKVSEKKEEQEMHGAGKTEDNIKVVVNEKYNKKPRLKNREKLMIERERVSELEGEVKRLNEAIQQMKEENDNLVLQTQRLQEENDYIRKENISLETVIEVIQEEDSSNSSIPPLDFSHHYRKEFSKTLQLQEEKRNLNNENWQLRRGKSQMDNVNRRLRQEKSQMENQIQQLRQEKSQMENENQQLRQEKSQEIENEIQRLRQENIIEVGSVVLSNEEVGRGAYGAVYKGDFNGTEVAVKGFHKIILSPHILQILEREITIASQCRHPNLLQFICTTRDRENHLLIVTELMDMTLRRLVEQRKEEKSRLEYQEVKSISMDVARGLNYLHSKKPNPIIHRDVNSANVLLWIENGAVRRAKVSDYGAANFLEACKSENPGAALYAAPEASFTKYDPKIDVFSYGILVCVMSICEEPAKSGDAGRRNQIDRIPNANVKELVNACTRRKSNTRTTMQDVVKFWQSVKK